MKIHFYYKFLTCTFIGALGEYMALATLSWYLLATYNDLTIVGKVLSFRIFPRFFMGFIGGYLADLHNRKRMIIFIYLGIMLTSFFQAILITIHNQPIWYSIAGILFLRSLFDGAEPSIRNAILPDIVDNTMIAKAIGYYSSALNLAAILAPMLAAFMMMYLKIATVFWIDWLFQVPSFIILFSIPKITNISTTTQKKKIIKAYREAILFIYKSPVLFRCMVGSILMMLVLFPFGAMLSMYIKAGLSLEVKDFGYISGIEAVGAVLAGVLLHKIFQQQENKFMLWYSLSFLSGICLILLSLKPKLFWIYILTFVFGLLTQLFRGFSRVIFQKNTPNELRGKVMSISISDSSFISIGLLFFTFLAEKITVTKSIFYMGVCTIALAVIAITIYLVKKR